MPTGNIFNHEPKHKLFLDIESFCETPISAGTPRYAEKAEVMLLAYAIDDKPAKVWDLTASSYIPSDLQTALQIPTYRIVAHNAFFDRTVLETSKFFERYGLYKPPIDRWYCTMALARSAALPGSLELLCDIFRLAQDQAKLKTGDKLIHLFCHPLAANRTLRRATRETHSKAWTDFMEYARLDVEAMRVLYDKIPKWNFGTKELALWHLDQRMNDRGFMVDLELANAAIETVKETKGELNAELSDKIGEGSFSASQRDAFLQYITTMWGVLLPDMRESTLRMATDDDHLPEEVRELLRIRLAASTASTAKYKALVKSVSSDGRLRGTLAYAGASRTRRWAGRIFQPQNLPRPDMKNEDIEIFIQDLKNGQIS